MHLRLEQRVDAHPDTVWRVLGTEFADIANWSTFVKSSRAIDRSEVPPPWTIAPSAPVPGRETVTKVRLTEVLTAYSDEDRSLTFHGVGLPRVVRLARDNQSVTPAIGGGSVVIFEIDFDLAGPFALLAPVVKRRMNKTFAELLVDLKRYVESADRGRAAS